MLSNVSGAFYAHRPGCGTWLRVICCMGFGRTCEGGSGTRALPGTAISPLTHPPLVFPQTIERRHASWESHSSI